MLIAEDLVLLTLDDVSGRPVRGLDPRTLDLLAGGALVAELALSGAIGLHQDPTWLSIEVHPTGIRIPTDPCLQRALTLAEGRARPRALVRSCGVDMFAHLVERLVDRGLLRRERQRRLLSTQTTWPAAETGYKQDMFRHLAATLGHGVPPSQRTATLISLLAAVDQAHRIVFPGTTPTHVRLQAAHIARNDWTAVAVRTAFTQGGRRSDWSMDDDWAGGDWVGGDWVGGDWGGSDAGGAGD